MRAFIQPLFFFVTSPKQPTGMLAAMSQGIQLLHDRREESAAALLVAEEMDYLVNV